MKKILIISTGGTFNKYYNPINGSLQIDKSSKALQDIASKWLCELEIINVIGKDSLDMLDSDRVLLVDTIRQSKVDNIIIVHGTDTMDITAKAIDDEGLNKCVVLTGAMVPYSIDPIEATANISSAFGYIQTLNETGVYIAMNGVIGRYENVIKDRIKGRFRYSLATKIS